MFTKWHNYKYLVNYETHNICVIWPRLKKHLIHAPSSILPTWKICHFLPQPILLYYLRQILNGSFYISSKYNLIRIAYSYRDLLSMSSFASHQKIIYIANIEWFTRTETLIYHKFSKVFSCLENILFKFFWMWISTKVLLSTGSHLWSPKFPTFGQGVCSDHF